MIQIKLTGRELYNDGGDGGLEIHIEGVVANPQEGDSIPVFIEEYEGKIRVVIWNGEQEPQIIELKQKEPSRYCTCGFKLTEENSVTRTYVNKDGGPSASVTGHYDSNEDFESDKGSLPSGRFDLLDDSDTCTECGELV